MINRILHLCSRIMEFIKHVGENRDNMVGKASHLTLLWMSTKRLPTTSFERRHDKTNKMTMRPAKTRISLGIRPVWSESSLCDDWVAKDPSFLHADRADSDQTGRMPKLIWVFAGRTATLSVLSCRGSNFVWHYEFLNKAWIVDI